MKVTRVEIFDCHVTKNDPQGPQFNPVLLRVHTDEGITGLGEVGLAYGSAAKGAVGILRDFAPFVIGSDPMNVEDCWEKLFRRTYWGMGGGPVVYGGISAYDIALWDIRGKKLNAPIWQLLGGKTNDNLRTYASQIQFGWGDKHFMGTDPEHYAAAAKAALAEGYDSLKVDPLQVGADGYRGYRASLKQHRFGLLYNHEVEMGAARIRAIREAVGPDVSIICEIHSLLGTNSAMQFAKAIEPYDIFYYEEPTNPLNTKSLKKVSEHTRIPVATGERSYTRWGFRDLLENQALGVVQPDVCLVGGITECKKVCDMANLYDATVQIHVCGGPVSTAAALQIEAVIPNFLIHEHHTWALKQCVRELCVNDYQPKNGKFEVPDAPGLGQELNDEVCRSYLVHTIE
ncbi:hypothetical protein H2204_011431 [Knufia peltigerae]|uniref:Mandelate racemase/muconate lactonizing enzyme C-terminal domain-containing protein n=1 Tax=Knufia peltigerae TaxID=1002370 RepID=A0AA38XUC4_9EURO|nr:hypothetical protein H2204_011431 [Knufia peltigerae]